MKFNIEFDIELNDEKNLIINNKNLSYSIFEKYFMIVSILNSLKNSNKEYGFKDVYTTINTLEHLKSNIEPLIIDKLKKVKNCDYVLKNYQEMINLKYTFIYNNKIQKRMINMKVYLIEEDKTYQLIGGVDNKNWKCLNE